MIKHHISKYRNKTGHWAVSWLQIRNIALWIKRTKIGE